MVVASAPHSPAVAVVEAMLHHRDVGRPAVVLSKPHYHQLVVVVLGVTVIVDFRFVVANVSADSDCQQVAPNDSVVVAMVET